MGGDRIPGPLTLLREAMERAQIEHLVNALRRIEKLMEDLEELGLDPKLVVEGTPPDMPKGVVLHLTAVIRRDLEEDVE